MSALRVGVGIVASGRVQLYSNPATSEVAGEYATLHDAIAAQASGAASFTHGACLVCGGVLLASAQRDRDWTGWRFESAGIERLVTEFNDFTAVPLPTLQ